jgi:hypothetical protein
MSDAWTLAASLKRSFLKSRYYCRFTEQSRRAEYDRPTASPVVGPDVLGKLSGAGVITCRDTTINALAIEAFNDLLKKYGKRQSVENPLLDD